jgi:UDP-glucose:(heptosyl)LPS alpha-1,3-glucosyltransferase
LKLAFFLFNYSPFGGLERNFMAITRACLARGHEVNAFAMHWQGPKPDGLRVTLVPHKGLTNHRRCMSYVEGLKQMVTHSNTDLVVGFNRMPGLDLYYAADVCYVVDVARRRGLLSRLTPRYRTYAAYEKAVFSPASRTEILYLSEPQKQDYIEAYGTPETRFHYLPPGIDKERIRSGLGPRTRDEVRREFRLEQDDRFLLMVGSDFRRKGVDRAIRALASLPGELKRKTHLFILGEGKPRPFKKLSSRLGVDQRVRFLGGREDVTSFLAAADMLLHLAASENTGNAIVEALVAGTPVLATANCGYACHVKKAQAGMVVSGRPFRQEEMNETLLAALTSRLMGQWRQNAWRYADHADLYSRPQVAVRVMEALALFSRRRF